MRQPISKNGFPCDHVGIFVRNVEKVSRFYTKHLGFKIIRDYIADRSIIKKIFSVDSPCRLQFLTSGNFGIELLYFTDSKLAKRSARTSGTNHWTVLVKDKAKFCKRLKKNKIPVIEIIKPTGTTFFIKDPENNLIEVRNYGYAAPSPKRY